MCVFRRSFTISLAALLAAAHCQAGIIDKSPNVKEIPIPSDVRTGFLEDQVNVVFFQERKSFALPVEVPVNFSDPGMYGKGIPPVFSTQKLQPGRLVDCYYLHFDPVTDEEAPADIPLAEGSMTFDVDILGIIARSVTLTNTNDTIGLDSTAIASKMLNINGRTDENLKNTLA